MSKQKGSSINDVTQFGHFKDNPSSDITLLVMTKILDTLSVCRDVIYERTLTCNPLDCVAKELVYLGRRTKPKADFSTSDLRPE
jgi:hypothetical protein